MAFLNIYDFKIKGEKETILFMTKLSMCLMIYKKWKTVNIMHINKIRKFLFQFYNKTSCLKNIDISVLILVLPCVE